MRVRARGAATLLTLALAAGACGHDQGEADALVRSLRGVAAMVQVRVDQAKTQAELEAATAALRDGLLEADVPPHVERFAPGADQTSRETGEHPWIATTVVVQRADGGSSCAVVGVVARRLPVVEIHDEADASDGCAEVDAEIDPLAGT